MGGLGPVEAEDARGPGQPEAEPLRVGQRLLEHGEVPAVAVVAGGHRGAGCALADRSASAAVAAGRARPSRLLAVAALAVRSAAASGGSAAAGCLVAPGCLAARPRGAPVACGRAGPGAAPSRNRALLRAPKLKVRQSWPRHAILAHVTPHRLVVVWGGVRGGGSAVAVAATPRMGVGGLHAALGKGLPGRRRPAPVGRPALNPCLPQPRGAPQCA
mmetsp:Transcript_2935/g.11948  ORF Transcript_2935/g.11948 Transcript_2935/m.11948 type:complete len:216 (-) Transcript_2935:313-960(-)